MKKTVVTIALVLFSSAASAHEGLPLWLASLIAWAQHYAHQPLDRQDRR